MTGKQTRNVIRYGSSCIGWIRNLIKKYIFQSFFLFYIFYNRIANFEANIPIFSDSTAISEYLKS